MNRTPICLLCEVYVELISCFGWPERHMEHTTLYFSLRNGKSEQLDKVVVQDSNSQNEVHCLQNTATTANEWVFLGGARYVCWECVPHIGSACGDWARWSSGCRFPVAPVSSMCCRASASCTHVGSRCAGRCCALSRTGPSMRTSTSAHACTPFVINISFRAQLIPFCQTQHVA